MSRANNGLGMKRGSVSFPNRCSKHELCELRVDENEVGAVCLRLPFLDDHPELMGTWEKIVMRALAEN